MIKTIYVDNFKSLMNFEVSLTRFQLWMGENGSGKTSAFDALRSIQRVLSGDHVQDIFPASTLTKWSTKSIQKFSVKIIIDGEEFDYELIVEHNMENRLCRIKDETLKWKGKLFFRFDGTDAHLYRVNRHTTLIEEGTHFPADWGRSMIASLAERPDNKALIHFRNKVQQWVIIQPISLLIDPISKAPSRRLTKHAENFAAWYAHELQESPRTSFGARASLCDVLPGFEELSLRTSGDSRKLSAVFRIDGQDYPFGFDQLSDGQKQLILLYTILESAKLQSDSVMLMDEPDNFVSLREIQPWLVAIREICDTKGSQSIIISHHPDVLNELAHGTEVWFSRPQGAHVVTNPFPVVDGLSVSETVARGWDDE